jgi:photosystem II stability/assembly factor-like uncharacterized protein
MRAVLSLSIITVLTSAPCFSEWESTTGGPSVRYGILSLALDPHDPSTLYAGDDDGGFFRSVDRGDSWETIWEPESDGGEFRSIIWSIAADPHNPGVLYVVSGGNVFHSADGGSTLEQLESVTDVLHLHIDALVPGTMYAESRNGLLKSTDSGQSWRDVSPGYGISYGSLGISPHDSNTLYVGASSEHFNGGDPATWPNDVSVLTSADGGASWMDLSDEIPSTTAYVLSIAVSPATPQVLYAGGWDGREGRRLGIVFKSADAGLSWTEIFRVDDGSFRTVAVDPYDADVVYVGSMGKVSDPATFSSRDGGLTWSRLPVGGPSIIIVDPLDNNTIYAAIRERGAGVYRLSLDGLSTSVQMLSWGAIKAISTER